LPLIFGYLPALKFSADLPPALLAGIFGLPGLSSIQHLFSEQALILNAFPVASIIGMFFSNQFADRNFAAERFLAFSHLVGGLSILGLYWVSSFWHTTCSTPTCGLSSFRPFSLFSVCPCS